MITLNLGGASNNTEKAAMLEKLVASLYIQKKPAFRQIMNSDKRKHESAIEQQQIKQIGAHQAALKQSIC